MLFDDPGGRPPPPPLAVDMKPGERYAVICIFADSVGASNSSTSACTRYHRWGGTAPARSMAATDVARIWFQELPPHDGLVSTRRDANDGSSAISSASALKRESPRIPSESRTAWHVLPCWMGNGLSCPCRRATHRRPDLDMLPDREYLISCFFRDTPQSPEHVDLGMFGVIRTSAASAGDD